LITFAGIPDRTEVNGLSVGGVLFGYSLGPGQLVVDGSPGFTNNVAEPNIITVGSYKGVLTLFLPGFTNVFGFGFAVATIKDVPNAATITLFDGASNVGALTYGGTPDPQFAGGFAGIQSSTAFNRVELVFNSVDALGFAVDNIRFANVTAVPEPRTVVLLGTVLGVLAITSRLRTRTTRGASRAL